MLLTRAESYIYIIEINRTAVQPTVEVSRHIAATTRRERQANIPGHPPEEIPNANSVKGVA